MTEGRKGLEGCPQFQKVSNNLQWLKDHLSWAQCPWKAAPQSISLASGIIDSQGINTSEWQCWRFLVSGHHSRLCLLTEIKHHWARNPYWNGQEFHSTHFTIGFTDVMAPKSYRYSLAVSHLASHMSSTFLIMGGHFPDGKERWYSALLPGRPDVA